MTNDSAPRRLLILGCSARKKNVADLVPAWELYDGCAFRVVRRCEREQLFPSDIDILILSALHGIITPATPIALYDLRMTAAIAARQRRGNNARLAELTRGKAYREVFLMMGRTYLEAITPVSEWGGKAKVIHEPQSIGLMLQRLKRWLVEAPTV